MYMQPQLQEPLLVVMGSRTAAHGARVTERPLRFFNADPRTNDVRVFDEHGPTEIHLGCASQATAGPQSPLRPEPGPPLQAATSI